MRIISGKYKGRHFDVPRTFKAHPTTDFAKENLFNILANLIDLNGAMALDLFAGTGSVSFELLSRGCREVICVEKDFMHWAFIRKIQFELKDPHLILVKRDAFKYIDTCIRTFDLIFADPPYILPELTCVPEQVLSSKVLNINGIFVMEHSGHYDFSSLPSFFQQRVYGAVNFSFFRESAIICKESSFFAV